VYSILCHSSPADPRQIHRHEVPRKVLHVSVGFLTLSLHATGYRTSQIHPALLAALVPITAVDVLRHRLPALNRLYVTAVGALMRESEVHGYNGVIAYLAGSWAALRFLPPDVAVMAVLLLSWCDPAASTAGRRWGRHRVGVLGLGGGERRARVVCVSRRAVAAGGGGAPARVARGRRHHHRRRRARGPERVVRGCRQRQRGD
jgi:hypothetical protein